jgi:hypothetical protein
MPTSAIVPACAYSLAVAALVSEPLVSASPLDDEAANARVGSTTSAKSREGFRDGIASSPADRISNHSGESLMRLAPTVHPYF